MTGIESTIVMLGYMTAVACMTTVVAFYVALQLADRQARQNYKDHLKQLQYEKATKNYWDRQKFINNYPDQDVWSNPQITKPRD
jgi:predicted LPLAT superfamily acyltransferase